MTVMVTKQESRDIHKLIGAFEEHRDNVNRRLDAIEKKLDEKLVCPFHEGVEKKLAELHEEGEGRQQKIGELEKQDIRFKAELTPLQKIQLNIGSVSGVGAILLEILKSIFHLGV